MDQCICLDEVAMIYCYLNRNEENHEKLKEISEEISKKCKGLPLAAKTLGGLLHFKKNKKEWLNILESEIWELEEVENGFLKPALLLSYYDLPLPLKGCFVYCSIFPKDYMIKKDLLVKLWMAQGFLNKSRSGNEDLEGIGDDYFNNLAMRSFFQDFTKDNNGNIIWCKMHDLVHDLAQYLTKNECSFTQINDTQFLNSSSRVCHLTLAYENEVENSIDSFDHFTSSVCNAKKLRTLQILNEGELTFKEAPADLFHRFTCLKVLCLDDIGLENLSGEIQNLIHLRYLDLSYNSNLKILPETISNLYNLQTLKLTNCRSLCELPREMWRMIKLRHLDISGTDELSHIPQGIEGLTCLRTLSDFIVGGASEGCKIGELKNLNLLHGDLSIRGLGRVNEALEMQMINQKQLHRLTLGFKPNEESEIGGLVLSKRMEDVLDVLEPHPDVMRLELTDYLGFKLSSWIGSTSILSNMKTLKLFDCINLTKFPAFGQLPSLEKLYIGRAISVKHIGFEFYSNSLEHVNRVVPFPKLKELRMEGMNSLEVWELQHGVVMPCLRLIEIRGCPKLKALPALGKLPSLQELIVTGSNELTHIGYELLYKVGEAGGECFNNNITFPKLKSLTMGSKEFRVIEVLSKMSSLEFLCIGGEATEFIKYIGYDEIVLFPNLRELGLFDMEDMEELKIGFQVMPLLNWLRISNCNKLKAIQGGSLSKLKSLTLERCASLYELRIPNLKHLYIPEGTIHPSLTEAFATTLQALEVLIIDCRDNTWTCMPEQVQQLTSLKRLGLYNCDDELEQRCRKDEGEDWRIISHIPTILINFRSIASCN